MHNVIPRMTFANTGVNHTTKKGLESVHKEMGKVSLSLPVLPTTFYEHLVTLAPGEIRKDTIDLSLPVHEQTLHDFFYFAGERARGTQALRLISEESAKDPGPVAQVVPHRVRGRIKLEEAAQVKLILVRTLSHPSPTEVDLEIDLEPKAQIDLCLLNLGGGDDQMRIRTNLEREAEVRIKALYLGVGSDHLDYNYEMNLYGQKSKAELKARGVLMDEAEKIFRDTIDFKSGSHGSVGDEEELVTLLSPKAKNISVPLLLCREDDVQGNHAASIGRLDDRLLFYLMSRGLPLGQAREFLLMAQAQEVLDEVKAVDPDLEAALKDLLRDRLHEASVSQDEKVLGSVLARGREHNEE